MDKYGIGERDSSYISVLHMALNVNFSLCFGFAPKLHVGIELGMVCYGGRKELVSHEKHHILSKKLLLTKLFVTSVKLS